MSPTLKSITTDRALTTTRDQLPVEKSKAGKKITRWKRRMAGNLVTVSITSPGLKRRPRANGQDAYYWLASATAKGREAVEKGLPSKMVRLHGSAHEIEERCKEIQHEAEIFCTENRAIVNVRYTATLGSLIKVYLSSEESGYQALKYNSKRHYDYCLGIFVERHGKRNLSALTRKDFFQWHKEFIQPTEGTSMFRISQGSQLMIMLRVVLKFGIGIDDNCERLLKILSAMQFERPAARRQYLTADQVTAICKVAREIGRPSVALAQAIQFETALRQKDTIGEWWPDEDCSSDRNRARVKEGKSAISTETWTSGLVWGSHISEKFLMAKPTSKSRFKKMAIADLTLCPIVMAEIRQIEAGAMIGPVIIDESTGLPYRPNTFRALWRQIADRANVPSDICNRDSRAGAITEGSEADVDLEHLRQFATHSQATMTQHYNRDSLVKARKVHRARNAMRTHPDARTFDRGVIIDAE